jgi:hypothetical protein
MLPLECTMCAAYPRGMADETHAHFVLPGQDHWPTAAASPPAVLLSGSNLFCYVGNLLPSARPPWHCQPATQPAVAAAAGPRRRSSNLAT